MASMNLGTLYVQLNADSKAFLSGMSKAGEAVKKFANQTKEVTERIASVSAVMLGVGAAAMKLAASVDGQAAASMNRLEKSTKLLAVQVADVLRPAVESLTATFTKLADWFAGLDDETKKQISTWATWVAGLAVAAKVISMVSGVLGGLAGAMSGVLGALGAVGLGPLLGIVATIVLVAAGIAALHAAFRTNLGGIADAWKKLVDYLSDTFSNVFSSLSDVFDAWVKQQLSGIEKVMLAFAGVAEAAGNGELAYGMRLAANSVNVIAKTFTGGELFKHVVAGAIDMGKAAADGFVSEWKKIASELGMDKLFKSNGGKARQPSGLGPAATGPVVSGAMRQSAAMAYGKVTIDTTAITVAMERSAAEIERATNDEARARFRAAEAAQRHAVILAAQASGDVSQLTDSERKAVQRDTGGAWEDLNAAQQTIGNAVTRMTGTITGALGEIGQAAQNIMSGFATAGAVGAVIAAIAELLGRVKGFADMLAVLGKVLGRVGDFLNVLLGNIFTALADWVIIVVEALAPLFTSLAPLFDAIAEVLAGIAPTLGLLGFLFQAIAPLLVSISSILGAVFKALGPVLRILFEIAKVVMIVILAFLGAIMAIWNTIIDVIAGIVQGILTAITLGAGWKWAKDVADGIRSVKADTKPMDEARAALADSTWDSVNAQNEQTTAAYRAADANEAAAEAAQSVAEALSNVPSGYKVALARFNAESGNDYSGALGTNKAGAGGHGVGGGSSTTIINGDVNIDASGASAEEVAAEVERAGERRRAQQSGGRYRDEGI